MQPRPLASRPRIGASFDVNPIAVQRVTDPGLVRCPDAPSRHSAATHTHATLVYLTAGHATFEQNGLWRLGPGDVMLIPAGQPHRRLEATASEYWGLGVCVPCFGTDEGLERLDPFERVRNGASAVASIAPERRAYVINLLQELATQAQADGGPNAIVQKSLLVLILNEIKAAHGAGPVDLEHDRGVVTEALRFIEQHCLQPLTLQQVARAVGRTAPYVTTAVSQATGKSVVEWVTAHRLAVARTLLTQTNERIDAIATRVGYADATHFIRMFRRSMGATPASYRTAQRSKALT